MPHAQTSTDAERLTFISATANAIEKDLLKNPHDLKNVYADINTLRMADPAQFNQDLHKVEMQYQADLEKNGHLPHLTIADENGHLSVSVRPSDKSRAHKKNKAAAAGGTASNDAQSGSGASGSAHAASAGSDAGANGSSGGSAAPGSSADTGGSSSNSGGTEGDGDSDSGSSEGASNNGSPSAPEASQSAESDAGSSPVTDGSVGNTTPAEGGMPENAKPIYDFLIANKLSPIAAAGILGNIMGESGGNPESVGTGGNGLIGWTPPLAGAVTGNPQKDLAFQLNALMGYINKNGSVKDINDHASSPTAAADYFMNNYERPNVNDEHAPVREGAAVAVSQASWFNAPTATASAASKHAKA